LCVAFRILKLHNLSSFTCHWVVVQSLPTKTFDRIGAFNFVVDLKTATAVLVVIDLDSNVVARDLGEDKLNYGAQRLFHLISHYCAQMPYVAPVSA
jgi:hypothetical protein